MRLPDFLIIGGMKCGSTTLYRDLMTHPDVFFPIDKEPESLGSDHVLTEEGRAAYGALFAKAADHQLCAEASTGYTKLPDITGAARRARELIGADLRAIYVVREPVARIVSHHHHARSGGADMPDDLLAALDSSPELLNYTRYATQVAPWIEAFGADAIRIVRFEDYTKARAETAAELSRFIGIDPKPELVQEDRVYNKSEAKPVVTGRWRLIQGNAVYRAVVRPLMSQAVRDRVRALILPKSKSERARVSADIIHRVYDALEGDLEALAGIMGSDGPVWNRETTLARYRDA
ncbi:MAG: hypothetical protein CMJ31_02980 [Phycisphaerae bacterium]|nr:hypothetical protein [Phycisphaerae bacterium]